MSKDTKLNRKELDKNEKELYIKLRFFEIDYLLSMRISNSAKIIYIYILKEAWLTPEHKIICSKKHISRFLKIALNTVKKSLMELVEFELIKIIYTERGETFGPIEITLHDSDEFKNLINSKLCGYQTNDFTTPVSSQSKIDTQPTIENLLNKILLKKPVEH